MSRSASKPNSKPETPKDQQIQLEGEVKTYPHDESLKKLDTLKHLYAAINIKDSRIKELETEVTKLRSQALIRSSNTNINQRFDQILERRNNAAAKQIELLKLQNDRLNKQLIKAKSEKAAVTTQIKLPSLTESYSKAFQAKIKDIGQIEKLKQHNQALQTENIDLRKQIDQAYYRYTELTNQYKQQFSKLKERREAEDSNKAANNGEIAKLKQRQTVLDQNKKKLQKEVTQLNEAKQSIFTFLKETLASVVSVESPNKLTDQIRPLKIEDLADESKKKRIKDAISANNRKQHDLKEDYRKANDQIYKKQKQLQKNQTTIFQMTNQIFTLTKKNTDLENANTNLTNEKNMLNQINNKNERTIEQQMRNIQQMKKSISILENLKSQNLKTITQHEKKISQNKQDLAKKAADNEKLRSKIQVLSKDVATLKIKTQTLLNNLEDKNTRISTLQAIQRELRCKIDQLSRQLEQLRKKLQQKERDLSVKIREVSASEATISKLEQDIKSFRRQLDQANNRLTDSTRIIDKINKQLIAETSQYLIGQTIPIKSTTPDRVNQLTAQAQSLLSSWKASYNFVRFFNNSDIITKDNLSFVLNSLEDFMGCTPFESRLVYKYDPLNMVNFHNYFDKVENLISFIKLSNGTIIGGFTVYPIDAERIQRPGKGFLFNLTHKKVYNIRSQPKLPVVSYDNYYYIFGNAEIRLKSQEKKVFSNFGIANSTFDNGPDPRTKFLNVSEMTNNELQIETYEFYRINFKM